MKRYYVKYQETTTTTVVVQGEVEDEAKENFWLAYHLGAPLHEVTAETHGPVNIQVWEYDGAG